MFPDHQEKAWTQYLAESAVLSLIYPSIPPVHLYSSEGGGSLEMQEHLASADFAAV